MTLQPTFVVEYEWAKRFSKSSTFYRLAVAYTGMFFVLTGPLAMSGPLAIVVAMPAFGFWFVLLSRQNRVLMKLLFCDFEFWYLLLLVGTHVAAKCISLVGNKRGEDVHVHVGKQIGFFVTNMLCLTWDSYAQRVPSAFRNICSAFGSQR